ncbi:MAG: transposase [Candidatus Endonucleobacter sp. (ex Gigantidas childressi)]|nr:transposase [Candidatus Endonucleobacter sp. (ex Gigantidas childressi)]
MYTSNTGRPSHPLLTLFRSLLLGTWYRLSDVQLAQCLYIPVAFQVATLLHPDHLLLAGSLGLAYLLPSSNLKCFGYSYESIYLIFGRISRLAEIFTCIFVARARSMTSDETASQRAAR